MQLDDVELERRTIRRVLRRIVPFTMLLYFIAFLDRVNIGFAALTMNADLGFSPAVFGFGAGIFFLGYFLFEVPSNLILHKVGARIWIARVMISWGLVSGLMAYVQGPTSFYILRFLLGVAEAGFFPGIILYFSYWFPARHRAGVVALFMAAAPISTALGSPLSAALLQMDGILAMRGWQWMFLVEAAPAVVFGIVVLFYLTDRPEKAKWLAEDERRWLVTAMEADRAEATRSHQQTTHNPLRALADARVLVLSLIYFGTSAGLYTLGIWSPQILQGFGLSTLAVGFVNAVPAVVAVAAMVLWARHSDRTGERVRHVALACLFAATGLALAANSTTLVMVLLALAITNMGVSAAKPPLWAMPTTFLTGASAAAGIAAINSIGNLGGFVGPAAIGWLKESTGNHESGLYFVSALLLTSALLVVALSRLHARAES